MNNDADIDDLKNSVDELNETLRCLKNEVKQLKERPIISQPLSEIPSDEQQKATPLPKKEPRYMKYEIKKQKEEPSIENKEPTEEEEISTEEINPIEEEMKEIRYSMKCLKYEVKQLKKRFHIKLI